MPTTTSAADLDHAATDDHRRQKPTRATTATTSGRRPTAGRGRGLGQRRQRPVQHRWGTGALAPVRRALRLRPRNRATPWHVSVSGPVWMQLLMRYETSGRCGVGWYTAGMMIDRAFASVDQRMTVRFRVVSAGAMATTSSPCASRPLPLAAER